MALGATGAVASDVVELTHTGDRVAGGSVSTVTEATLQGGHIHERSETASRRVVGGGHPRTIMDVAVDASGAVYLREKVLAQKVI